MAVARASVVDIRPAWPGARSASLATYAGYWHCSEPMTSRARVALWIIRSDSYRYRIFILIFRSARLPKLASAISSSRAYGWLGEGIGSVVVAPFTVTLTMCVAVKENAPDEERVRGRDVNVRADLQTDLVVAFAHEGQRLEDSRNALVVSCGDVQVGDRGRSKETLRALTCQFSSSLLEGALLNTAHPAVQKKKNPQTPLTEDSTKKDLLTVVANIGSEMFSQGSSSAADDKTTTWPPSCRLSLKKLLRPAWPPGHDGSAVIIQR